MPKSPCSWLGGVQVGVAVGLLATSGPADLKTAGGLSPRDNPVVAWLALASPEAHTLLDCGSGWASACR